MGQRHPRAHLAGLSLSHDLDATDHRRQLLRLRAATRLDDPGGFRQRHASQRHRSRRDGRARSRLAPRRQTRPRHRRRHRQAPLVRRPPPTSAQSSTTPPSAARQSSTGTPSSLPSRKPGASCGATPPSTRIGLNLYTGGLKWSRLVASVGNQPWGRIGGRPDGAVVHEGIVYRGDEMGLLLRL